MEGSLEVFALGGLGEVGKNCYVIETQKDIIIIDCGVKFINGESLVSSCVPNFSYLVEKRKKIKGLFFTHAHDDHITGAQYLLEKIPEIPIFGSEFTVSLAKQKTRINSKKKWTIFRDDTVILVGDFRIVFFRVTHSIPGSFGIVIECFNPKVRIISTGDFKFDWTHIGEEFNLHKLVEESQKGVDLLLSESTNAEIEGNTPSESTVVNRLESIISSAPARVIITSFSSNVYRLKKVIEIAKKTGRYIVLLGSSLLKAMKAIRAASLWELDSKVFLKAVQIAKTPPEKLIIFSTGSQGEERAVLSRLANSSYPGWKILKQDTIIWTSSPILDNRVNVEIVSNKLFNNGALIYEHNANESLHVSGHASQNDLKLMLKLTNPRFLFPCHGEYHMLKKHAHLAQEVGMKKENVFVCQNGEVISWLDGFFHRSDKKIDTSPSYILDDKIVPNKELEDSFGTRHLMAEGGVMFLVLFGKKDLTVLGSPRLYTYGFINMQKKKKTVEWWKWSLRSFLEKFRLKNKKVVEIDELKKAIIYYINDVLLSDWIGGRPLIKIIDAFLTD